MQCPVCFSNDVRKRHIKVVSVYSQHPYDIDVCMACGHVFTSPAPTTEELDFIYGNTYGYEAHKLIQKEKRYRGREYAAVVAGQAKTGKVLEIGCMHGYLLSALKARGYDVTGIELDGEAAAYCRSQGLNVTQSSMETFLAKSKEKYDVIFMSHVLEHIANPNKGLELLKKHLAKNGKLIVVVPNSTATSARLFGKYWGYWQVPVHINHFNQASIRRLYKDSDYTIKALKFFGGDSLLFLSTIANVMGAKNDGGSLGPLKKILVRTSSIVLRPWYRIGGEDMLVVAEAGKGAKVATKPKAKSHS